MANVRGTRGKVLQFMRKTSPPEPFPIHERLREESCAAKISQHELATRLGKSQDWVSRVEAGRREVPSKLLKAYAAALGVTVSRLFDEAYRAAAS